MANRDNTIDDVCSKGYVIGVLSGATIVSTSYSVYLFFAANFNLASYAFASLLAIVAGGMLLVIGTSVTKHYQLFKLQERWELLLLLCSGIAQVVIFVFGLCVAFDHTIDLSSELLIVVGAMCSAFVSGTLSVSNAWDQWRKPNPALR